MFDKCRSWMPALAGRRRLEQDMADEIAFHVEVRAQEWIRKGLSPQEATRRARIEFGGAERIKEDCRRARGLRAVDELRMDVRYAWRSLRRAPGFTLAIVLLLAFGIGANTAMFSLVDAALWRTLPVHEPDQLVFLDRVPGRVMGGIKKASDISYPLMQVLRERDPLLEEATTFRSVEAAATIDGRPEPVRVLAVADNFYVMLGIASAAGRLLQVGDGQNEHTAVLSYGYWQRRFARAGAASKRAERSCRELRAQSAPRWCADAHSDSTVHVRRT